MTSKRMFFSFVFFLVTTMGQASGTMSNLSHPEREGPSYLYLSDTTILDMDTLQVKTCQQNFPAQLSVYWSQAAIVPYQGQDCLMLCGGSGLTGCLVWTNTGWQSLDTPFFNKREDAASSFVGGDWLVTGGHDPYDEFSSALLYESDIWQEYLSMPSRLQSHCQVTVGGDVFVIGGSNIENSALSSVYKLSEGIWSVFSSLKTARSGHMCSVMGDNIFVISGEDDYYHTLRSVEVLSPGSNVWVDGPSLPEDISWSIRNSHSVVFKDSLYVFDFGQVYRLDSGADQWITVKVGFFSATRYIFPAPLLYDHQLHCIE